MRFLSWHDIRTRNDLQLALLGFFCIFLYMIVYLTVGQVLSLYALLLAVLFLIILKEPKVGIYCVLFGTFLFEKFFTLEPLRLNPFQYKIYFVDFLILFTACGAVLQFLKGMVPNDFLKTIWKHHKPLFAFFVVTCGAFIHSLFARGASVELSFSTLKNYALYSIVFFLVVALFRTKESRNDLFNMFFWCGAFVLAYVVIGIARGQGLWVEATPLSTYGTRLVGGPHAFYLTLFGIAVIGVLTGDLSLTPRAKRWLFWALVVAAVGFLVALVRHIWLSSVVVFAIWCVTLAKRQLAAIIRLFGSMGLLFLCVYTVFAIVAGVMQYSDSSIQRFNVSIKQRLNLVEWVRATQDTSVGYRYALWSSALQLWRAHPLMGIGFGQLVEGEYELYFFAAPVRDVHNNYIGVLVQMGIVGAVVIAWWFGRIVLHILRARPHGRALSPALFWTRSSLILFMVSFGFSVLWDLNSFNIIWWMLFGLWHLEEVHV